MSNSVKHFLEIYQRRKSMQEKGTTNPPESIKNFTAKFVETLKKEEPEDMVDIISLENSMTHFVLVKNGKVLAELEK